MEAANSRTCQPRPTHLPLIPQLGFVSVKNKLLLVKPLRFEIYLLEQGIVNTPGEVLWEHIHFCIVYDLLSHSNSSDETVWPAKLQNIFSFYPLQKVC